MSTSKMLIIEYEDNDSNINDNDITFLPKIIEDKENRYKDFHNKCEELVKECDKLKEKYKFFKKMLEYSEIKYNLLLFPQKRSPGEFIDLISKLEDDVVVVDLKTRQKIHTRLGIIEQNGSYRITRLKNMLNKYPLNPGDIVGTAVDPYNNQVILDFGYRDEPKNRGE